jgi:hypothetical protein
VIRKRREKGRQGKNREASRHGGEGEKRKKIKKTDGETRVSSSHRCPQQSQRPRGRVFQLQPGPGDHRRVEQPRVQ